MGTADLKLTFVKKNISAISEYKGEFLEGQRHGHGTLFHPDGSSFQGEFLFGQANGPGILKLPNGDEVIGDFQKVTIPLIDFNAKIS